MVKIKRDLLLLPMYDWSFKKNTYQYFWEQLVNNLKEEGFLPSILEPDQKNLYNVWSSSDLLLSQSCGLPFIKHLKDKAKLVATPIYGANLNKPGFYHSVIVSKKMKRKSEVSSSTTFAINDAESQSGYLALFRWLKINQINFPPSEKLRLSGSHLNSMNMIYKEKVECAAIDCLTYYLTVERYPHLSDLQILDTTKCVPGLPFITSIKRSEIEIFKIQNALQNVFKILDSTALKHLGIYGIEPLTLKDYQIIEDDMESVFQGHEPKLNF